MEHSPERKKRRGRKAAVKPRDGIEEKEEGEGEEEEEEEEEEDDDEYEEGGRRRDGHAATDNESEHRLYNGYRLCLSLSSCLALMIRLGMPCRSYPTPQTMGR